MSVRFDLQRFAVTDNTESNIRLPGTNSADSITNSGAKVTIAAKGGNDTITNYGGGANVSIDSGAGKDVIHNHGNYVTINANADNDSIINYGVNPTVTSYSYGKYVLIQAGDGNDTVSNNGMYAIIDGGNDNDSIINTTWGINSTITGGVGNDYVLNGGARSKVYGGDGNDTIQNTNAAPGSSIYGNAGNDYLTTYDVDSVSMDGGAGNDKIALWGSAYKLTVKGGTGNDTILGASVGGGVLYQYTTGDGNDLITGIKATDTLQIGDGTGLYSSVKSGSDIIVTVGEGKITLEGASGKDFTVLGKKIVSGPLNISSSLNNTLISGSALNDTITNSGANVTIAANGGNDAITLYYRTTLESNKVTVDAGDGSDTVTAFGNYLSVSGGAGRDSINGHHNYGTIHGGADGDTIDGNHYGVKLYGDGGNDVISITSYSYNSIFGGAGDDTLAVQGGIGHLLNSGTGNDKISLGSATNSTVYYANGDGNDTVWGFNSTDVLSIDGSYKNPKKSGKDVIVTVGNGKLTFKDAATNLSTMTINGKTIPIGEEKVITQQDALKTFMMTLDEYGSSSIKTALDKAVKAATNGKYETIDEATTAMVNDCKYSASGDEFLRNYCGIIIGNDDTGAISGSDAGGSTTKTAKSVIPESGAKKTLKGAEDISFNVDGATIWYTDVGNVTSDKQHIMDCVYTWWMSGALKLIEESYGYTFNDSNAKYKNLYLTFAENGETGALAYTDYYKDGILICVNLDYYNNLKSNDYDCTSPKEQGYLDRTFTHETVHAVMVSKFKNKFWELPQFITEGTAELIHGIDDFRTWDIENLASDSDYLKSKLKNMNWGTSDSPSYAAGYMFLRWLAKEGATITDSSAAAAVVTPIQKTLPTGVKVKDMTMTVSKNFKGNQINLSDYDATIKKVDASAFKKAIEIFGNKNDNTILGGTGADYLAGGAGNDTINGGTGNDIVSGGTGNDSLNGGAGNDSLYSGTGNNTLTGGAGSDNFFYEGGKLLITDYAAGDELHISNDKISKSEVKNKDVILTTGSGGSITITGGMGKNITVVDKENKKSANIYGKTLKVTKSAPVTLGSDYAIADASSAKVTVMITGNSMANSILGGAKNDSLYGGDGADILFGNGGNDKLYGDAGNDSLNGGAGSDSLWGGAGDDSLFGGDGDDTFVYTANTGTDTIFDYSNGDMLQILDSKGSKVGFSKAAFSNSDLTLSVKGGGTIVFDDVSSSTTFNINGTNYKISGSKLVKK